MITRLSAWLDAAGFLVLEEIDELRNGRLFNTKSFETRMARIHSREPW